MKLLFTLLLLAGVPVRAALIYDSGATPSGLIDTFFDNNLVEAGDQVRFAGTERRGITAMIGMANIGPQAGTADVTLRIYGVGPGSSVGALVLPPITAQIAFGAGLGIVWWNFSLAGATLPDEVIWTIRFSNAGPLVLGLQTANEVVTGFSSPDFVMWDTGSGLTPQTTGFGSDNYIARFYAEAVPEPAVFTLTGLGLIVLSLVPRYLAGNAGRWPPR